MKPAHGFGPALLALLGMLLPALLLAQKGELAPTDVAVTAVGSSANVVYLPGYFAAAVSG